MLFSQQELLVPRVLQKIIFIHIPHLLEAVVLYETPIALYKVPNMRAFDVRVETNDTLFSPGGSVFGMPEKGPRFRGMRYPSPEDLGIVDSVADVRTSQVESSINICSVESVLVS